MVRRWRPAVKITADTNIIVRAIPGDDPHEAALSQATLAEARTVAIPVAVLCEFVWVLGRGDAVVASDISAAIRGLISSANVAADRPATEAGLALLEAGGDFADGAIAQDGAAPGAAVFASFDVEAVCRLSALGHEAVVPG